MKQPLRVLYLINYAGKAGTEKYVENLIRHFSDGRAECHFAWNLDGQLSERMAAQNIPSLKLSMRHPLDLAAAKTLAQYCREHKIEVIHAQYPRENFIAILSKRFYSPVRVVYTNHLTLKNNAFWKLLNRIFTPKNHAILAVCTEGRELMLRNGVCADRIRVIYNGIEPASARPARDEALRRSLGLADGEFTMSILARLEPEKGISFLLQAMQRLKTLTDKPFRCIICGDGSLGDALRAEAEALGLGDRVLFAGFRSDTPAILASSDLYLNSSECNEALSFAILEAMNASLPLVVTDVGGNAELARDGIVCGRVLPFGDAEGFARACLELMENDSLREEYARAALQKVRETFDLNKLADDVFESYF